MSHSHSFSEPRLLAVAAAAALLALGNPVLAAPVVFGNFALDATYSLGGGPTVNGMTDPSASVYSTGNGGDLYLSKNAGNNSVFFHTYGSAGSTTYFGARASGAGTFAGYTRTLYSGTFAASVATPTFSFFVESGQVGLSGAGSGSADLKLEVRVNGVAIARDHTTVSSSGGATTCSDNGDGLGTLASYMQCGNAANTSVFGSGGLFSASLAGINAGDIFTLDYDIVATVSGISATGSCSGGYGGDGGYGGYGGACPINATARSGDPFNLSSGPNTAPGNPGQLTLNGANATDVPEPGSLALVGLALAGAAVVRRRREPDGMAGEQG